MSLNLSNPGFLALASPGASTSFRYLRILITESPGGWLQIHEIRFFVGMVEYPLVNMTGPSSPTPLVATASSVYGLPSTTFMPWRAVASHPTDEGHYASSQWHSGSADLPQWWQIDLGAGNGIMPTGLRMQAYTGAGQRYPTAFQVLGSNTGEFAGEETVIYSNPSTGDWPTVETFFQERTFIF